MKSRIFTTVLCFLLLFANVFVLSACGNKCTTCSGTGEEVCVPCTTVCFEFTCTDGRKACPICSGSGSFPLKTHDGKVIMVKCCLDGTVECECVAKRAKCLGCVNGEIICSTCDGKGKVKK